MGRKLHESNYFLEEPFIFIRLKRANSKRFLLNWYIIEMMFFAKSVLKQEIITTTQNNSIVFYSRIVLSRANRIFHPREEWVIIPDSHPAIIKMEQDEQAYQNMQKNNSNTHKNEYVKEQHTFWQG